MIHLHVLFGAGKPGVARTSPPARLILRKCYTDQSPSNSQTNERPPFSIIIQIDVTKTSYRHFLTQRVPSSVPRGQGMPPWPFLRSMPAIGGTADLAVLCVPSFGGQLAPWGSCCDIYRERESHQNNVWYSSDSKCLCI